MYFSARKIFRIILDYSVYVENGAGYEAAGTYCMTPFMGIWKMHGELISMSGFVIYQL